MKPINMSREMIEDCLINSKVFRDAMITELMTTAANGIHNEILKIMRTVAGHAPRNKIAFIKAVREASSGRALEFARAFPAMIPVGEYEVNPPPLALGLADAKHLVEMYAQLHAPCIR